MEEYVGKEPREKYPRTRFLTRVGGIAQLQGTYTQLLFESKLTLLLVLFFHILRVFFSPLRKKILEIFKLTILHDFKASKVAQDYHTRILHD